MESSMAMGARMVKCGKSALINALSLILKHRHTIHTHTITTPHHHHHFTLLLNLAFPFDFLAVPFFSKNRSVKRLLLWNERRKREVGIWRKRAYDGFFWMRSGWVFILFQRPCMPNGMNKEAKLFRKTIVRTAHLNEYTCVSIRPSTYTGNFHFSHNIKYIESV